MQDERTAIIFRRDDASSLPPFRQIVEQVLDAIRRGQLVSGDRLPSVREVVRQVTINPNTVQRAYREIEHLGLAEGRPGLGTFITDAAPPATPGVGEDWRDAMRAVIARAHEVGVADVDILHEVTSCLRTNQGSRT